MMKPDTVAPIVIEMPKVNTALDITVVLFVNYEISVYNTLF